MANSQKFTLSFDAQLNISQLKGAIGNIQNELNRLQLPQSLTKGIQGTIDGLLKQVQTFEASLGKDITSKADFSKISRQAEKIGDSFEKLKLQVRDIFNLSNEDLAKLFPNNIKDNIKEATAALSKFKKESKAAEKNVKDAEAKVASFEDKIKAIKDKNVLTNDQWDNLKKSIKDLEPVIEDYKNKIAEAQKIASEVENHTDNYKKSSVWRQAQKDIAAYTEELEKARNHYIELKAAEANSTTEDKRATEIQKLNDKLTEAEQKVKAAQQALNNLQSTGEGGGLQQLIDTVGKLTGLDMSKFVTDTQNVDVAMKGIGEAIDAYINQRVQEIISNMDQLKGSVNGAVPAFNNLTDNMHASSNAMQQFDDRTRDVNALKSRIQYFFGLNNAINLFKRAVREAFNTIKDLDKAMTETAVVTDFTVADMWKQLPEYTKRANELGVTTQAAYESATLFYQQGLNTQQAAELSTETLKMARIAGLDAAEATDRMTNALRGFNMALDATAAQRVDDVYSQLAAHTASNVDEISTAMTKVASLAHSANMEFETTAAFLAQIIETTRESAETAGTALKTVVARFSEVKKLYSEDQLRGTDEEGQAIDVNRISVALRTAGIDLNKYFLGEVGLDDIFMELASKWDSLTSVQQRYIATQAAGSRQQSRFIALMQDYARTQELVGMAYEANGASAKQFAKTQDSLQSKLARLKNAWNEFLMGLTNSVIVKTAVDLLTDLLNVINKITSAFGDGVGSILKWGAAIGGLSGLKGIFRNGGVLDKVLGGIGLTRIGAQGGNPLAQSSLIAKAGKKFTGLFNMTPVGAEAGRYTADAIAKGTVNTGLAIGNQGALSASLFGAAGAAVPTATIAGFAGLLIAAEAALVAWQDYATSGKKDLKQAEKNTQQQKKQLSQTQENNKKQKEAYEAFIENEKIMRTSVNQEEVAAAKVKMEEAANVLYSIDAGNITYVNDKQGNLTPQLNVSYAKQKMAEFNDQEVIDEANLAFDEAKEAFAQAKIEWGKQLNWERDITNVETAGLVSFNAYSGSILEGNKHFIGPSATDEEIKDYVRTWNIQQQTKMQGFEAQATQKITEGATTLLSSAFEDQDLINSVAQTYGKIVDQESFVNKNEAEIQNELSKLMAVAQDKTGKMVLDVINGSYENAINEDEFITAFNEIDKQFGDILTSLLTREGQDINDILSGYAAILKKNQIQFRKKTVATLFRNGIQDYDLLERIGNELSLSQQQKLLDLSESFTEYGEEINNVVTEAMANTMLGDIDIPYNTAQLESFITSLSNSPVLALDRLKEVANNTENAFSSLAKEILRAGENNIFSKEGQVQWFLATGIDEVSDEIDNLVEANGKITGKNIQNLAKDCKSLQALLDNNVISANALALAINALQSGQVSIFDLNQSVLELYESFDTVSNAIQRAGQFIKDFDPGEDWGDAFDFIDNAIEKLTEFVDNRELGNPQARNYWKAFFANDPEDLAAWEQGIALLKQLQGNGGANFWTDVVGFKMDENGNIADMGLKEFETFNGSYRDYIRSLAGASGEQFTDDFYDLMIRNAANHDYGFMEEVSAIELNNLISAMGDMEVDKVQIQAIADAYGLDPQQIVDAYNEKYNKNIDWSGLEEKTREFYHTLEDKLFQTPEIIDQAGDLAKERMIRSGMTSTEVARHGSITPSTGDLLAALGVDKNGTFTVDQLYAKIGQIVPEVTDGSISAADWVQEQIDASPDNVVTLPVTYEVVRKNETTNQWETEKTLSVDVEVHNMEEYERAVQTIQENSQVELLGSNLLTAFADAQTEAEALADFLRTLGEDNNIDAISGAISGCKESADELNAALKAPINKNVNVSVNGSTQTSGTITFTVGIAAKGGIVKSYAAGTNNLLSPGLALTGEEAPEIVWNKEKGYAYIAGADGPEINNLQPGDQVFNGDQTKEILKRSGLKSFAKGTINSYGDGTIWDNKDKDDKGTGAGAGDKEKTPEEWKNELDWLYNLMEDIVELERDQKDLEEQYKDYLSDQSKTGRDLYNLLIKQLGNLYTQLNHQTFALEKREQEMREFMDTTNDQDEYLWYNWNDRTLEIDWDAIEAIQDEEQYKHVKELVDEAEAIQDKMDDAEDAITDINNQIQELENIWRDTYIEFENRVIDAIVKSYQKVIDNYSELNDTLNETNNAILDSIQKEISLQRQIRDNTKTEEEIANDEAQLAFLRRDTTGGNDLAALQLEKELANNREQYEDNLVDQAVQRLQDDNQAAAEQREKQIEIMQAQLDYQSENGEFNEYMRTLLESAMGADGELLTNSDLVDLLKTQENWDAMTAVQKDLWDEELDGKFKEVAAFILKDNAEQNGTYITALTAAITGISTTIGSYSQALTKIRDGSGSSGGGGGAGGGSTTPSPKGTGKNGWYDAGGGEIQYYKDGKQVGMALQGTVTKEGQATPTSTVYDDRYQVSGHTNTISRGNEKWEYRNGKWVKVSAKNGGLFDTTGLIQIDGTADAPEYVLNARQTEAFLKLADVLPAAMSGNSTITNTYGNQNISVSINVDKIDSDYSVDQMVSRVKDKLYEDASYRNVNVLNFLR